MDPEKICHVYQLGSIPYQPAWDLQNRLAERIAQGEHPPALLLLEHPHTYTLGRRAAAENLVWDEAERERQGVSVYWVDRGGDVTYHGPGQLVGYPLLPLAPSPDWSSDRLPQADYVGYVRRLEETLILTLSGLGLACGQLPGLTGVWVQADVASRCLRCPEGPAQRKQPAKIASIGVKVDVKGISRHGFALNVDPDMRYWEGIIPCGLKEVSMVSLADFLHPVPTMDEIMDRVTRSFSDVFGYRMVESALVQELKT